MNRIKNSWTLLERSLTVMADNKKLMLFPIVSGVMIIVIALFFFGTLIMGAVGTAAVAGKSINPESLKNVDAVMAAAVYFFAMFIATFFNVAFYHEIIEALNGRPVGIRKGLAFAMTKLFPILLWAGFAGAIGYLIKLIEERVGLLGKIMVNIIGLAWSVAAVFAIPVIICEGGSNPIGVLQSSARSLKKAWGETLIGYAGVSLGTLIVLLASALPFVGLILLGSTLHMASLSAAAIIGWIVFAVVFIYISNVAGHVYKCALYLFASTGQTPAGYTPEMMNSAWSFKK